MSRLKELDGLRFVAAALVLLSHLAESPANGISSWLAIFFDGSIGVLIFFVLSGYVITRILDKEIRLTNSINMKEFYLRRILRIWPASYAYIAASIAFISLHIATASIDQIIIASTHLWNYCFTIIHEDQSSQGHTIFGHFWSLALEEQFYWTWPVTFLIFRKHASRLLVVLILAMPIIRIGSYFLFPVSRGQLTAMFHTALDPIALGAWLALNESWLKDRVSRLSSVGFYSNIMFLLIICPIMIAKLHGAWEITYGRTLEAASAGLLIFALAHGPETLLARLLRTRPLQFGGRISYSLYLWQQLYSLPGSIFPEPAGIAVTLSLTTATASYYLIERPFLRLKDRYSKIRVAAG